MSKSHIDEIDFQRALLIAGVILVHIVNFGNIHPDIKSGILSFLMPTFLLITGYLMNADKPAGKFAVYLLRIFLPYVILVTGYMVMSLYLPVRDGIRQLDWNTFLNIICIRSIGPYWFFRVMLICGAVCYATFRCLVGRSGFMKLTAYGTVLLLISHFTPILAWEQAFYFFMGVVLRVSSVDYNKVFAPSALAAVPLMAILLIDSQWSWGNVLVLAMAFCFLSSASYVKRLCHGKPLEVILYIGRNTLPIYMFHPAFTMAGKSILPVFSFDGTGTAHAITVVAIGIAGSLLTAWLLDKLRLSWIFGRRQLLR